MSHNRARREITPESLWEPIGSRAWLNRQASELVDEAPLSYKDIEAVMADQADLVKVVHKLRSVLNYKGL
jgi:tRNA-splicing ligase RtcB